MIVVVAPEPAPWVDLVLRRPASMLGVVAAEGAVLFAPWRLGAWRAADAALAAATRHHAPAAMARRFALRAAVDRAAAAWLPAATTVVVAPSCGALHTLAAAERRGIATILIQDLPLLRLLNADLDEAARRHPQCPLLARYRAPARLIVRQEREHALARRVFARGLFAARELAACGHPARLLSAAPRPSLAARPRTPDARDGGPRLLLAGPPCGRSGVEEALAAVVALGGATLVIRASDALEPRDLLRHPAVKLASGPEVVELRGIDLVVAPAPCETYPPEVLRAIELGVPVVATRRAAGPVDLLSTAAASAEIEPHDVARLVRAAERLLSKDAA
jgi:hypothetical protein